MDIGKHVLVIYDDLSKHVLQWVKEGKVLSFEMLKKRYKKRLKGRLLDLEVEK